MVTTVLAVAQCLVPTVASLADGSSHRFARDAATRKLSFSDEIQYKIADAQCAVHVVHAHLSFHLAEGVSRTSLTLIVFQAHFTDTATTDPYSSPPPERLNREGDPAATATGTRRP
jgi:hypothetical protein